MSKIDQRVSVECPLAQAATRLRDFFRANGNREGNVAKLTLGIDVDIPGLPIPLSLERSVIATIQPHHLAGDMEPRYSVQWAPEHAGPFPLFAGELVVEGEGDYDSFALRISGDYAPPLGILGKGFDMALGNRIAQNTTNRLLHHIRVAVEHSFGVDEDGKRTAARGPEAI